MIHQIVDIDHWKRVFPLDGLREKARSKVLSRAMECPDLFPDDASVTEETLIHEPILGVGSITSPYHLAILKQVRQEASTILVPDRRVAVDAFAFALGEPDRRDVTKTGGLPYWPAADPWPQIHNAPALFLAQLSFLDSHQTITDLPSDILLVFGHRAWVEVEEWDGWRPDLVFFWQRIGNQTLIATDQVPTAGRNLLACFGAIHRTYDYPDAIEDMNQVPRWRNGSVLNGTKIGGARPSGHWAYFSGARYIGSIGSVDPSFGRRWPFLNVEQPIATMRDAMRLHNRLTWDDLGRLDLYFDGQRVLYRIENG
jgi:hypothetical protein